MASRSRRHLLGMFFATVLVLVLALAWMATQLVRQERAVSGQRVRELCDAAADLAVAGLQKRLSEAETQLASPTGAVSLAQSLAPDSVLLQFRSGRLEASPPGRLLFLPDSAIPAYSPHPAFAEADALEFRRGAYGEAIAALRVLSRHPDSAVRAEAQLRLARCLWKAGDAPAALTAYQTLAQFQPAVIFGIPVELAAHEGRLLIFDARRDRGALYREAKALCAALSTGQTPPGRRAWEFYRAEGCGRLPAQPQAPAPQLALSGLAAAEWAARRNPAEPRRIVWQDGIPFLLLTRSAADRTAVLVLGPHHLEAKWLTARPEIRLALSDPSGRFTAGAQFRQAAAQAVRLASVTQLPWTLHASPTDAALAAAQPSRQRLFLAVLFTLVLLVLAGIYFIGRAAARELEVGRLQTDFVASISHEFRTPITALRQLSEMLVAGRVPDDAQRQEFYRAMAAESERLHRLVEGLLNFGRLEAGSTQFHMESLDLCELLAAVIGEFRASADSRGYSIELDAPGPIRRVRGDRAALACIFWNLLDNAVKYSPDCRTVWVGLAHEGHSAMIRVRDRGIGIPPQEQKGVFEKFVRAAAARSLNVRGAGVGLAMAARIAAAHHGTITLESAPNQGSTFTVTLPEVE